MVNPYIPRRRHSSDASDDYSPDDFDLDEVAERKEEENRNDEFDERGNFIPPSGYHGSLEKHIPEEQKPVKKRKIIAQPFKERKILKNIDQLTKKISDAQDEIYTLKKSFKLPEEKVRKDFLNKPGGLIRIGDLTAEVLTDAESELATAVEEQPENLEIYNAKNIKQMTKPKQDDVNLPLLKGTGKRLFTFKN